MLIFNFADKKDYSGNLNIYKGNNITHTHNKREDSLIKEAI